MDTGYSKWRKLDNAALAFPLVTGKNDTRVFRFYCQLKEEVNGEILQAALDQTMEKYPLFQAVLRKGLFWFYLEHRDIRAVVKPETEPPCSRLYIPDKKSLLFQVSYDKNRINFEVFHALTDGTGAMHFLQELVQDYLILAHPQADLPQIEHAEEITHGDKEEDSFSQYYSSDIPKDKEKKKAAVKLKGEKLVHSDMHVTEVALSVKDIHRKARSCGVSITVLLTAMMLCSIREEIPKNQQKRPVALMIPVNLRNYFPSQSMTNFFGWIEVGYIFSDETTFEDVLLSVKKQFEEELVKEKIAMHMSGYVRIEKNPFVRAVPLEIKKYFLMIGANLGSRSITAVYSNIGIIRLPEEYKEYIQHFGIFASTNSLQMCSCSYGDEMVLGFTSKIPDNSIQRNFQRMLGEENVSHRELKNEFPGYGEKHRLEKKENQKPENKTPRNTSGKNKAGKAEQMDFRYDYFNLDDKNIFRDHEPLLYPAPACNEGGHFYYKEKKLSFTKPEEVYKRALQMAKKGRILTFHWRGGYLTKTVLEELLDLIEKAGAERGKKPRISLNWPQAVIRFGYVDAEIAGSSAAEEVQMEEANEGEMHSD